MATTIPAGEFKAKCLKLLDKVAEKRETLVITKRGKPVAQAEGVKFLQQENDKVVFELGSGTYTFASDMGR